MPAKTKVEQPEAQEEAPEVKGASPDTQVLTQIMGAISSIADSIEHLEQTTEEQQSQIDSLRDNPPAPQLATYSPPDVSKLKAGEMAERREMLIPRFMPKPKFRDGDYVQIRSGSDLDERFTKSGKPNAKGFVFDVPKGLTKAAEWKYTVKFPGIGKDGVIESDLEYATA